MRKVCLILLSLVCTLSIEGQTFLKLYKANGTWVECDVTEIDSVVFYKKVYAQFEIASKNLAVGETFHQKVETNSDGNVTYSTSDTSVAKVNAITGEVVAEGEGMAVITAHVSETPSCKALTATYTIYVDEPNVLNGHPFVDLGLPSGTCWATYNVGASRENDPGCYFAWGETTSKTGNYTSATYKFYASADSVDADGFNVTYSGYTKYVMESQSMAFGFRYEYDDRYVLEDTDDAACANWGEGWLMPTQAQKKELETNCTWTACTINNVFGFKITSTINNKYIFLPAGGYWTGPRWALQTDVCFYWTKDEPYLYRNYLMGWHDTMGYSIGSQHQRVIGMLIRPVCVR